MLQKQQEDIPDDAVVGKGAWTLKRRMTIGRPATELYALWRRQENLPLIAGHVATVVPLDDRRSHWRLELPGGVKFEWDSEIVVERPGECLGWRSLPGASVANEGEVTFHPAPADWGTEVTLTVRFDPPAGLLGDAAVQLATAPPKIVADKALRRFKSLAETGEIPSTDGQPHGSKA
jgi:uncharacterized membrane protein